MAFQPAPCIPSHSTSIPFTASLSAQTKVYLISFNLATLLWCFRLKDATSFRSSANVKNWPVSELDLTEIHRSRQQNGARPTFRRSFISYAKVTSYCTSATSDMLPESNLNLKDRFHDIRLYPHVSNLCQQLLPLPCANFPRLTAVLLQHV